MKKYATVLGLSIALTVSCGLGALADGFDEKVVEVKQRMNSASVKNDITGKDRRELQKMMQDVSEHKRKLVEKHHGTLSVEDEEVLEQELNGVSQRLDEMKDAKVASKPKAKDAKPAK